MYICSYVVMHCFWEKCYYTVARTSINWMLLNTHMNANIQLVMNSCETLFHDRIFFPDNSLTVNKIPNISLTCFKFSDISGFSRQVVILTITFTSTRWNMSVYKRIGIIRAAVLQCLCMDMKFRCQCRRCLWCTGMHNPWFLLHIRGCRTSWSNQPSSVRWVIPVYQPYGNADLPTIQSMQHHPNRNVQNIKF